MYVTLNTGNTPIENEILITQSIEIKNEIPDEYNFVNKIFLK